MAVDQKKLDLYKFMRLGRAMEDRILILYKQGRIPGAIYLGRGQEAITIGTSYALQQGDTIAGTHRDLIAQLPRGMDLKRIFAHHLAKATGPSAGKDGNTHMGDLDLGIFFNVSMLPNGYPVSVGAALAFKFRKEKRVALAYCGEGATSRGDWHESLNFSAVHQLPNIFVVINNQYAYSTPTYLEMKIENISSRAAAYGMPGVTVDGNDVEEVYAAAKEAIDRARDGGGPTLIEAMTMRMLGHAGHDPAKYVPIDVLEEWKKKDPIDLYEKRLIDDKVLDQEKITEIMEEINREIDEAVRFAEESPMPDPETVIQGVYAA